MTGQPVLRFRLLLVLLLLSVICGRTASALVLVASSSTATSVAVPRIPASEFFASRHYYSKTHRVETPIIVENVLGDATKCESLAEELIEAVAFVPIDLQRKQKKDTETTTTTDIYECTVQEAIDLVMQSKHEDSLFAFCEGLLQDRYGFYSQDDDDDDEVVDLQEKLDTIHQTINQAKNQVFRQADSDKSGDDNNDDWFEYFPEQIRPSDCVIIAGEGATSTLHRDPFEWTGTSLCLEGSKLWRFIPPLKENSNVYKADEWRAGTLGDRKKDSGGVQEVDEALESYRLASVAWVDDDEDDDEITLSAGWQSDYSFFAGRSPSMLSARALADINGETERINCLEEFAASGELLSPDFEMPSKRPFWTAIQQPGDLLIIPAYWWHQTYAAEPSISIASQRCDSRRDAARVIKHVLETTNSRTTAPKELQQEDYSHIDSPNKVISSLVDHLRCQLELDASD